MSEGFQPRGDPTGHRSFSAAAQFGIAPETFAFALKKLRALLGRLANHAIQCAPLPERRDPRTEIVTTG
jgi:hypothetical protein